MKATFILCLICSIATTYGQKYRSVDSKIRFFSEAPLENITATNTEAVSAYNSKTGEVVFSVPIRSFEFRKSLMQQHFNEKFMESEQYPKAIFKGKINAFDIKGGGKQKVTAKGEMTIHGVTQAINVSGTMELNNDNIYLKSVFPINLDDYKVKIPQVLWQNIAEQVEVTINFTYKPIGQ